MKRNHNEHVEFQNLINLTEESAINVNNIQFSLMRHRINSLQPPFKISSNNLKNVSGY